MTMARSYAVIVVVLAMLLGGCGVSPQPRHFVILIDVSKSIDPASLTEAFNAIETLAKRLRRGDAITVIPIKNDAEADAPGTIIRATVPTTREPYDQDLIRFARVFHQSLERMRIEAIAHPGEQTDILGSLDLAEQDFEFEQKPTERHLIILSDFIEEDAAVNFKTASSLAKPQAAKALAISLSNQGASRMSARHVFLARLRSREYSDLPQERRQAISEFWTQFFLSQGVTPNQATDGIGLLETAASTIER